MASREGGIKLNYFDSRSFSSFYQYYRGFMPGTGIHRLKKNNSAFLKVYLGDRHTEHSVMIIIVTECTRVLWGE